MNSTNPRLAGKGKVKILAISGSPRQASTNTAMLYGLKSAASKVHCTTVYDQVGFLPVFSPDLDGPNLPSLVNTFASAVTAADCLVIASPEYVRSIPGGLKNAIDWLVSRDELNQKPIVLMHASHRGDDMLAQLRIVLATVSQRFNTEIFLRFTLMNLTPNEVARYLAQDMQIAKIGIFLDQLDTFCASPKGK